MDLTYYRPAKATPATKLEVANAIARHYVEATGIREYETIRTLVAHAEHEGYKYNFNFGGLKAGDVVKNPERRLWTTLGTHELVKIEQGIKYINEGKETGENVATLPKFKHFEPPGKMAVYFRNLGPVKGHVATRFRAFESLDDGVKAFVKKILVNYNAGDALRMGVEDYVRKLKSNFYFTADTNEYITAVSRQIPKVVDFDLPDETLGDLFNESIMRDTLCLSKNPLS